MHGWNGQVLSIRDYKWNIDYSLIVELGCEVWTAILFNLECLQQFFLFLQNEGDANIYTIDTRLAHTLPVADIDAVSPAGDDTLSVSLGEVCYA